MRNLERALSSLLINRQGAPFSASPVKPGIFYLRSMPAQLGAELVLGVNDY